MRHNNLSLAGVIFGLFVAGISAVRYFILYPDPDKGIYFALFGLLIIAVSWNYAGRIASIEDREKEHQIIYEKIKKLNNTVTDLEQYVVDKKV